MVSFTHAPCLLKLCIPPSNRIVRWWFFTEFGAELPLDILTDRHSWNVSTQNAFSLSFAAILVNRAPSGEIRNYCTPHIIEGNFVNFMIHPCNYILLSQVYCVRQVVKTPTIISNNPVHEAVHLILTECARFHFLWISTSANDPLKTELRVSYTSKHVNGDVKWWLTACQDSDGLVYVKR